MSLNMETIRAIYAPVAADLAAPGDQTNLPVGRRETLVTASAVAIAVMIVAIIAVSMSLV